MIAVAPGLSRMLLWAGLCMLAASIGWWWLTYEEVMGYGYLGIAEAGACLISETSTCQLARALCRSTHPLAIVDYRSPALWLGVATVSAGVLLSSQAGAASGSSNGTDRP